MCTCNAWKFVICSAVYCKTLSKKETSLLLLLRLELFRWEGAVMF